MSPGTQYRYEILLDGRQAVSAAKVFKQQLEKELATLKFGASINTGQMQAQMQKAAVGLSSSEVLRRTMTKTQTTFRNEMMRIAPETFLKPMENSLARMVTTPSEAAIGSLNKLQKEARLTHRALGKMGVDTDSWAQAGKIERGAMALQAAQRRIWGVRSFGYQLEARGRGMMMAGGAGLGGAAVAGKQYLEFAKPLGRAARNLELNAGMTERLDRSLRELAGTTSLFKPQEQAEQLYLWAAATGEVVGGIDDLDRVLQRTTEVQKLSHLGMVSQEVAVNAVTDVMSQYQMSVDDTQKIVATLIKVAAVSKAEVSDLAEAFKFAGARAEQANTSFEETAAIIQLLSAFGLRGSIAGRGLSRLIENLIAPSKQAQTVMDELFEKTLGQTSREALSTAEGQFIGMSEAVSLLATATAELTEMERAEFVARITTQNAARVLIPLLELELQARTRNIDAIQAQANLLEGVGGVQEQAFVQMMEDIYGYEVSTKSALNTLNDQWEDFANSTPGRAKRIEASLSSAITSVGKVVTEYALPYIEDFSMGIRQLALNTEESALTIERAIRGLLVLFGAGALTSLIGKGITIYADVAAIAMAASMKKAADQQFAAAMVQLEAARMQGLASAGQSPVGQIFLPGGGQKAVYGPAAGKAAAGGMAVTGASLLGGAATVAAIAAAALAALEIISRVTTGGRGLFDLMNPGPEARAAGTAARVEAGGMSRSELQDRVDALRRRTEVFAEYRMAAQGLPLGQGPEAEARLNEVWERRSEILSQIPEQYRGISGQVVPGLVVEEHERINAQLEEYEERLTRVRSAEAQTMKVRVEGFYAAEAAARTLNDAIAAGDLATPGRPQAPPSFLTLAVATGTRPGGRGAGRPVRATRGLIEGGDKAAQVMRDLAASGRKLLETWNVMYGTVTKLQARETGASEMAGMWGNLTGLTPWMGDEQIKSWGDQYLIGLQDILDKAAGKDQWEVDLEVKRHNDKWSAKIKTVEGAEAEIQRLRKESLQKQEQAEQGFQGLIESALQPTAVTSKQMIDSRLGAYKDQWDEPARQMRAAIQDPASRFRDMLIPEHIRGMGEDEIGAYGEDWIERFYAGEFPEQVNWGAFVENFRQDLKRQGGRRRMGELGKEKLAEAGITATSEDVMYALGMDSPLQQMYFGGLSPTEAGEQLDQSIGTAFEQVDMEDEATKGLGGTFGTTVSTAMKDQFADIDWTDYLVDAWDADLGEGGGDALYGLGVTMGGHIWGGVLDSITEQEADNFVMAIATRVLEMIKAAIP